MKNIYEVIDIEITYLCDEDILTKSGAFDGEDDSCEW